MAVIHLRALPLPLLVLLLVLGAVAITLLASRERGVVSRRTSRCLLGLRLLVGLGLLVTIAEPVQILEEKVVEQRQLLVVVDSSRSFLIREPMRLEAQVNDEAKALNRANGAVRDASRQELALMTLESGWINELRKRFDVNLYSISETLLPFGPNPPTFQGSTDLLRPLADELARRSRSEVSGVVLMTDGHNHGPGSANEAQARLERLKVPVVTVGIGALQLAADLGVESIETTGRVFAGDELKAQVTLASVGVEAQQVTIDVLEGNSILQTVRLSVPSGDDHTAVPISIPTGSPGRKKLTVRVSPLPGEAFETNNSRDLWVDVLSLKARVLLLDGSPRWEERYLRSSWSRDKNVELQSFLVTMPPERRLPSAFLRSREALFSQDILVLGDVEPGLFAKEELETLRDFVSAKGGTLVVLAGERSMPYRWADTPLSEMLPVQLLDPPPPPSQGAALAGEDTKTALTLEGQSAEITRLIPGRERNIELWEMLPAPRWICPVAGAKPGTRVLATAKESPVLAWRAFGSGRVFWVGIDSTWKWRYKLGDELHRRFWGQLVRWAVSRQFSNSDDQVKLSTDSAVYRPEDTITVEALVRLSSSKGDDPCRVDAILEHLSSGERVRLRLEPIPRSDGRFEGRAKLTDLSLATASSKLSGEYRIQLDVPSLGGYSSRADRASARFVIEPELDAEANDIGCDVRFLSALAETTGGRFLPLSRFREAADSLPAGGQPTPKIVTRSLIDRPGILALILLGSLLLEWVVRRQRDLV